MCLDTDSATAFVLGADIEGVLEIVETAILNIIIIALIMLIITLKVVIFHS